MQQIDQINQLGSYISSSPDFGVPVDATKPQDEADLSALEAVLRILAARKEHYKSTDALTLGELTLDNQLIINKQMQMHIQELESLISSTVLRVKETING